MQLWKKVQKKGCRAFMRDNHIIIADKRGKPRVIIGSFDETACQLRTGNQSSFNRLGKAQETPTAKYQ